MTCISVVKAFPRQRGYHQLVTFFLDLTADTGLKADDGLVDTLLAVIDDLVESLYDI